MPLTNVPEAVCRSVSRKFSLWRAIWQWRGETATSSIQIGLEASRPMDNGAEKRNSDFPRGPLRVTSLGCTVEPGQGRADKVAARLLRVLAPNLAGLPLSLRSIGPDRQVCW